MGETEDTLQGKRREVRRVWTEQYERKEEQAVPRIPSTFLAERERREERRGRCERWSATEYQKENKLYQAFHFPQ